MREMDRLIKTLFPMEGQEFVDLKFFPGEQQVTVEEFCEEVHSGFVQVDSGMSTAATNFPEQLHYVSIDRFLVNAP